MAPALGAPAPDTVAVFNAGSSSIRFALFRVDPAGRESVLFRQGKAEGVGHRRRFVVQDPAGTTLAAEETEDRGREFDHDAALRRILAWLDQSGEDARLRAAGHRVVHGGGRFAEPCRVTPEILGELEGFIPLALLHQPHNLRVIRALETERPGLPQVACFDTAFHGTQPPLARRIALPAAFDELGVRRYGFHGISYEFIASRLPAVVGAAGDGRVVVAHLGNGASLCALRGRRSIATTMGFSTLDGIAMGTRCGSLDPGVILYLLRRDGMGVDQVEDLLYHRSGLLGISGVSHDMRELLASPDPRAAEAVDYFVYRITRELGSLAAALGGLDALVFTAGIGEHAPEIRARVCRGAAWLGIDLDEAANREGAARISTPGSRTAAWVIPTNEELMIARHTLRLVPAA
jgi:acetate kinase